MLNLRSTNFRLLSNLKKKTYFCLSGKMLSNGCFYELTFKTRWFSPDISTGGRIPHPAVLPQWLTVHNAYLPVTISSTLREENSKNTIFTHFKCSSDTQRNKQNTMRHKSFHSSVTARLLVLKVPGFNQKEIHSGSEVQCFPHECFLIMCYW